MLRALRKLSNRCFRFWLVVLKRSMFCQLGAKGCWYSSTSRKRTAVPAVRFLLVELYQSFLESFCRLALLAQFVESLLVFAEVVHAPMGGGHDNREVHDRAEHQHERDGEHEDQHCVQQHLGNCGASPDDGQGAIELAELRERPIRVEAGGTLRVVLCYHRAHYVEQGGP